jgi:hypothetical protein
MYIYISDINKKLINIIKTALKFSIDKGIYLKTISKKCGYNPYVFLKPSQHNAI